MKLQLFACAAAAALVFSTDAEATAPNSSETQIRALLNSWMTAFEAKDVDAVMRYYAPGDRLVAFDLVPPLAYRGAADYRKDYADFFAQFKGPLHVEDRDTHIETGGNIAYAYGLERVTGTMTDGTPVDMWIRWTSGYRKMNGRWYAVHDHVSVPTDFATGKALLDLKP